jgi:hypothetical protein
MLPRPLDLFSNTHGSGGAVRPPRCTWLFAKPWQRIAAPHNVDVLKQDICAHWRLCITSSITEFGLARNRRVIESELILDTGGPAVAR